MITSNYSCFTAWYTFLSCNCVYLTQPLQVWNNPQCCLVMDVIKLFRYSIRVERTVKNVNSLSADVIESTIRKRLERRLFLLFH